MSDIDSSHTTSLIDHLKNLAAASSNGAHSEDILLATAVVLIEIAYSDHNFDKFEKSIITAGLKSLFQAADGEIANVMTQAQAHLHNLRGTSSEIALLKESLDSHSRNAVAKIIDDLVNSHGGAQGFEGYLRNRVRHALGLPIIPVTSSEQEM